MPLWLPGEEDGDGCFAKSPQILEVRCEKYMWYYIWLLVDFNKLQLLVICNKYNIKSYLNNDSRKGADSSLMHWPFSLIIPHLGCLLKLKLNNKFTT